MRRYALRDDQWDRIKDGLPGGEGTVGVTAADNRLFVEAVLTVTEPVSPGATFQSALVIQSTYTDVSADGRCPASGSGSSAASPKTPTMSTR